MITKSKTILLLLLLVCSASMAQTWEYVNLRQYRVKDMDVLKAFVKNAYPFFNQSKRAPTVGRFAASGESGRIYAATYLTTMDQFSMLVKERGNDFEEYSKSPGNLAKSMGENVDGGTDDVLWHYNKDLSNIPAGYDGTKMLWRKLNFVTVKSGMMDDYIALMKQLNEAEKKAGISYTVLVFEVAYGAPSNTLLISLPAANAVEYYTGLAARLKIREANPELLVMRRKAASMTTNTLIDQVTTIPY